MLSQTKRHDNKLQHQDNYTSALLVLDGRSLHVT
uniref:Uncharacterized protein n=1 Tax=Anguilla anguilla TaxID=7936 RepID=A0A0E9USK9_ANGAN